MAASTEGGGVDLRFMTHDRFMRLITYLEDTHSLNPLVKDIDRGIEPEELRRRILMDGLSPNTVGTTSGDNGREIRYLPPLLATMRYSRKVDIELFRSLLVYGANPNYGPLNKLAIVPAVLFGRLDIVNLLIEHGAFTDIELNPNLIGGQFSECHTLLSLAEINHKNKPDSNTEGIIKAIKKNNLPNTLSQI